MGRGWSLLTNQIFMLPGQVLLHVLIFSSTTLSDYPERERLLPFINDGCKGWLTRKGWCTGILDHQMLWRYWPKATEDMWVFNVCWRGYSLATPQRGWPNSFIVLKLWSGIYNTKACLGVGTLTHVHAEHGVFVSVVSLLLCSLFSSHDLA